MATPVRIKRSTGSAAPQSLLNAELSYSEGGDGTLFIGVGTGGENGTATQVVQIGGAGVASAIVSSRQAGYVFAGPSSGANAAPTWRGLVASDIPDISSTYLTVSAAGSTYLTQSSASSTYLSQSSASSTYLSQNDAASTYLTQNNAANTYLTQSNASSTYLTQSNASSSYLTISNASSTYAPLSSPALTGTPTAPTAANGTSSNQVATTQFVGNAIDNLVGSNVSAALDTLRELGDALGSDANFAGTVTTALNARLVGTNNLNDVSNITLARSNLGLAIGSDVQGYDATLAAIAGVTVAADQVIYATGSDQFAVANFSSFGRSLVDDSDASTARSTLGLGSMATQSSSNVSITGGTIDNVTLDGGSY